MNEREILENIVSIEYMNKRVMDLGNETAEVEWLMAYPDGADGSDIRAMAEDAEVVNFLQETYQRIMQEYNEQDSATAEQIAKPKLKHCPFCLRDSDITTFVAPSKDKYGNEYWYASAHCPDCNNTYATSWAYDSPEEALEGLAEEWNS